MFGFALTLAASLLLAYVVWRLTSVPSFRRVTTRAWLCGGGLRLGHPGGRALPGAWRRLAVVYGRRTRQHHVLGRALPGVPLPLPCGPRHGLRPLPASAGPPAAGLGHAGRVRPGELATIQGIRPPVVTDYEVRLKGLAPELDGKTLVALSDLHLGAALGPRWMEARAAQVQALKPDLIVLLGDVFEGHGENFGTFAPAFHRLSAPLGVWAVDGDHQDSGIPPSPDLPWRGSGSRRCGTTSSSWHPGLVLAGRSGPRDRDRNSASSNLRPFVHPGASSCSPIFRRMFSAVQAVQD